MTGGTSPGDISSITHSEGRDRTIVGDSGDDDAKRVDIHNIVKKHREDQLAHDQSSEPVKVPLPTMLPVLDKPDPTGGIGDRMVAEPARGSSYTTTPIPIGSASSRARATRRKEVRSVTPKRAVKDDNLNVNSKKNRFVPRGVDTSAEDEAARLRDMLRSMERICSQVSTPAGRTVALDKAQAESEAKARHYRSQRDDQVAYSRRGYVAANKLHTEVCSLRNPRDHYLRTEEAAMSSEAAFAACIFANASENRSEMISLMMECHYHKQLELKQFDDGHRLETTEVVVRERCSHNEEVAETRH